MRNEGVTADAKTVTVMVIKVIHQNFKTVTVTVFLGNKFLIITRLPVINLTQTVIQGSDFKPQPTLGSVFSLGSSLGFTLLPVAVGMIGKLTSAIRGTEIDPLGFNIEFLVIRCLCPASYPMQLQKRCVKLPPSPWTLLWNPYGPLAGGRNSGARASYGEGEAHTRTRTCQSTCSYIQCADVASVCAEFHYAASFA